MKWTLITGAAKGLGKEIALHLAQNGYSVVIHYRKSLEEAKKVRSSCVDFGVKAEIIQGDFKDFKETVKFVKNYLEKFPDTQNLINNVGNYFIGSVLNTPAEVWQDIFFTNLHLPFLLSNLLAKPIINEKGSIINIGVAGLNGNRSDLYSSAYTSAKSALLQLTKSLAREMAERGVRVNMISPGYLENSVDLREQTNIPIGHPTSLTEIAKFVAFLLNPQNSSIIGQNIEIAGGVRL